MHSSMIRRAIALTVGLGASLVDAVAPQLTYSPPTPYTRFFGMHHTYRTGCRWGRWKPYRATRRHSGVAAIKRAARKTRR